MKQNPGPRNVKSMKTNQEQTVHVPPYEASEKDWQDFFEGEDISEVAFGSLDQDDEWLCVASQHGRIQLQQTSERLAEQARKPKGPPVGYEFDR